MYKNKFLLKNLFILLSFLMVLFSLSKLEYEVFTYQLLESYNKTDRIDFFCKNLLTENRFLILKVVFVMIYVLLIILFLWKGRILKDFFLLNKTRVFNQSVSIFEKLKTTWQQISIFEKIALFIPLLIYIIFWWLYSWQNDEIFSYTFFVDRGILVCATYYPAPNNHVAFLIVAAFLNKIIPYFFSDFICLKLPATFAAIISLWTIWLFFYRKNQKILAWFSFFWVTFFWGFFFYATHGRGYSWIILLFLWSSFAALKILSYQQSNLLLNAKTSNSKYWLLWSFCMILGCYTIPIFIYAWFGSLLGLWSIGTNKIRKESLIVSLFSGIIILFLYSPILIFNGVFAIIGNDWVAPLSLQNWLQNCPSYLWDTHHITGLLSLLTSMVLFFHEKKYRKVIIYFWCIAYSPYFIVFIQRVLPFERVFLYRQIAEILMLCFCLQVFLKDIHISILAKKNIQILLIFVAVLYGSLRIYSEYYRCNISTNVYQFAAPLAKKLYYQKPSSILVLEDTYNVFLRYYFRNTATKVDVLVDDDTDYKVIIVPREKIFPLTKNDSLEYVIFYKDSFVKGFIKR